MLDQTQYVSVERNDWQFVSSKQPHDKANQNMRLEERRDEPNHTTSATVNSMRCMGSISKRSIVLAQILSPSGRIHIHHGSFHQHMSRFPQSAWRFPDRSE